MAGPISSFLANERTWLWTFTLESRLDRNHFPTCGDLLDNARIRRFTFIIEKSTSFCCLNTRNKQNIEPYTLPCSGVAIKGVATSPMDCYLFNVDAYCRGLGAETDKLVKMWAEDEFVPSRPAPTTTIEAKLLATANSSRTVVLNQLSASEGRQPEPVA